MEKKKINSQAKIKKVKIARTNISMSCNSQKDKKEKYLPLVKSVYFSRVRVLKFGFRRQIEAKSLSYLILNLNKS